MGPSFPSLLSEICASDYVDLQVTLPHFNKTSLHKIDKYLKKNNTGTSWMGDSINKYKQNKVNKKTTTADNSQCQDELSQLHAEVKHNNDLVKI